MCVHAQYHILCVGTCGAQKSSLAVIPQVLSPLLFEAESPTDFVLGWLASEPGTHYLCFPSSGRIKLHLLKLEVAI